MFPECACEGEQGQDDYQCSGTEEQKSRIGEIGREDSHRMTARFGGAAS